MDEEGGRWLSGRGTGIAPLFMKGRRVEDRMGIEPTYVKGPFPIGASGRKRMLQSFRGDGRHRDAYPLIHRSLTEIPPELQISFL